MSQRMRTHFNPVKFMRSAAFMSVVGLILLRLGMSELEAIGFALVLDVTVRGPISDSEVKA